MDDVEYMDRIDVLMKSLRDRLPADRYASMMETSSAGEPDFVLDELLAFVDLDKLPLTATEAAELREITTSFEIPLPYTNFINDRDRILRELTVVDAPAEEPEQEPATRTAGATAETPGVVMCPTRDLQAALQAPVAFHVDLTPTRYREFVEHFANAVGVGFEVNLVRTNPEFELKNESEQVPLRTEQADFVPDLVEMLARQSLCGGGVLLRGFEQWWTKRQPEAENFVRMLPAVAVRAKSAGVRFHVGLGDMVPATAGKVLNLLCSAEPEAPSAQIPAFLYVPPPRLKSQS